MRARHLLAVAPLVLLLPACGASQETGTEIEPEIVGQAPAYEITSEEEGEGVTDIVVTVDEVPVEEAVVALAGELQEERTQDGAYALTVLCSTDGTQLAVAAWAQGEAALSDLDLDPGEVEADVEDDATCEAG
ncbi:hypothetical protein [Pseudokineococcus sp. 1T1Z-3]|uniref:hypothetical protein n=1 Tax=Pseudokineococcus sp. 1T1Z-3 TaxID=3132745 RepID=UPI0030996FD1